MVLSKNIHVSSIPDNLQMFKHNLTLLNIFMSSIKEFIDEAIKIYEEKEKEAIELINAHQKILDLI